MKFEFGQRVRVAAEAVRVTGSKYGTPMFGSSRHAPRYTDRRSELALCRDWPGYAIGSDISTCPNDFDIEPDLDALNVDAVVRLRRFPLKGTGIVIGSVRRTEGGIVKTDARGQFVGPTRELKLREVALKGPAGRAVLILAHDFDLRPA